MSKEFLAKKRRFDPRGGSPAVIPIQVATGPQPGQECWFMADGVCNDKCRGRCAMNRLMAEFGRIDREIEDLLAEAKCGDLEDGQGRNESDLMSAYQGAAHVRKVIAVERAVVRWLRRRR